jgi:glutathione peroxidase
MKRTKSIFYFFGTVLPMLLFSCGNKKASTGKVAEVSAVPQSFYDFSIKSLIGDSSINMANYKGKKILVVNVASKCGYTYQYEGLEKLYEANKEKLVIIGLPCNQFLGQEPGGAEEIAKFCSLTYGVTFPMTEKVDVMGEKQHPIYTWLTSKALNNIDDYKVSWNFNKFLLDENGKLIAYFGSKTKPMDEEITSLL